MTLIICEIINSKAKEKTQKRHLFGTPGAMGESDFPNEMSYNIS